MFWRTTEEEKMCNFQNSAGGKYEENDKKGRVPGGPVAKIPCSQCRGPRFESWSGN